MTHARKQIRDAFKTAVTGLSKTGSRVFTNRVHKMEGSSIPGIIIYTKKEKSDPTTMASMGGRRKTRMLDLICEIYIKKLQNFDDELDEIAVTVENAVFANSDLQNLAKDVNLIETEYFLSSEGEKPTGICSMIYQIEYHSDEEDAETIIN